MGGIDLVILKALIEYGVLGLLGYFYVKSQNKTTNLIQREYEKLVDNLITTQDATLKDLKIAIDKLSNAIIKAETFHIEKECFVRNRRSTDEPKEWSSD